MIDHLALRVSDLQRSRRFYLAALAPLDYQLVMEVGGAVGLGTDEKPTFWIAQGETAAPVHVAFGARDRASVDAFHRAALRAGGTDHGAPGLRPRYHPHYYGAFALDPDGNNVEAVCHRPE